MTSWIKIFIVVPLLSLLLSCAISKKIKTYGGIGPEKTLFYYHTGKGEPIIIVHGGPGMNHNYFLPSMNLLEEKNHLIYYDQKACGQSEIPSDTNDMRLPAFIEDINKIKERFGLKKFHLMTHSWGAVLGVQYALKYPESLQSLILVSPAALSSSDMRDASRLLNGRFDLTSQEKRNQIIQSPEFKTGNLETIKELFKLSFALNMAVPSKVDSLNLYFPEDYSKRNAALRYLFKDLADYDLYPLLKNLYPPVLIISGAQDVGVDQAKKINSNISNSQLKIIPDSGHFPFLEQKELFNQAIQSFLNKSPIKNK